ncbi:TolC family protein [Thermaurantimonas aggregans]|uniref:TolC family protein n=1 Tax=Thermaurantimonas aggregans TaxID=2173829 RepID=UPI0023EF855A|nr:efflux transporter outer membrane subunit [Thermaurantimonas aggregans]MCX8148227.1 efflux transporter outer membrane subunit [Thermaurantimonas aggregans]
MMSEKLSRIILFLFGRAPHFRRCAPSFGSACFRVRFAPVLRLSLHYSLRTALTRSFRMPHARVSRSRATTGNAVLWLLFAGMVLLTSCGTPETLIKHKTPELPHQFSTNYPIDTLRHTGRVSWKDFFLDPALIRHIEDALRVNADLLQASARIRQVKAAYTAAGGALLPSLQVRGRTGGDRFGRYTMTGVGNFDTNLSDRIDDKQRVDENFTPEYYLALESSWEIDVWGRLRQQRKGRRLEYLASEEAYKLATTMVVTTMAELYFTLQALDDEREIIEKELQLQREGLEKTLILKETGRTSELAVKQFEAQVLNTEALLRGVLIEINAVENAINALKMQANQPVDRSPDFFMQSMDSAVVLTTPANLLFSRPDIRRAELLMKSAGADVMAARYAFFPQLMVNPYVGLNAFKSSLFFDPASLAFGVMGHMVAPIFQQNQLKAGLRFQKARYEEAQLEYNKTIVNALNEINTHLVAFDEYLKISRLKESEARTLKVAETVATQLFLNGYASYLDLLTVRREVLRTQLDFVEATLQRKVARLKLYRALGGGWF